MWLCVYVFSLYDATGENSVNQLNCEFYHRSVRFLTDGRIAKMQFLAEAVLQKRWRRPEGQHSVAWTTHTHIGIELVGCYFILLLIKKRAECENKPIEKQARNFHSLVWMDTCCFKLEIDRPTCIQQFAFKWMQISAGRDQQEIWDPTRRDDGLRRSAVHTEWINYPTIVIVYAIPILLDAADDTWSNQIKSI